MDRGPDGRDRKVLRGAALELHRLATDMKERRGHMPRDEPPGYIDAFSLSLREMARLMERASKGMTAADAKRAARDATCARTDPAGSKGHANAVFAVMVKVNQAARCAGLDAFEGDWTDRTAEGRKE